MVFQHDNARPHTAATTRAFLDNNNVVTLKQPAYSPDFNLCDRWVFGRLELNRKHISFQSAEEIKEYVTEELKKVSKEELTAELERFKIDLKDVIDRDGAYL